MTRYKQFDKTNIVYLDTDKYKTQIITVQSQNIDAFHSMLQSYHRLTVGFVDEVWQRILN